MRSSPRDIVPAPSKAASPRYEGPRPLTGGIDVFLLKLPNHNIDYPSLSLPTLKAALAQAGFAVHQGDFNVELRDRLLSEEGLEVLTHQYLPRLAARLVEDPPECNRIRKMTDYLIAAQRGAGFANLERTKRALQARDYETVFADPRRSAEALTLFVVASLLHGVIDLALTFGEVGEGLPGDPVTDFLGAKVDEVLSAHPRVVAISTLDIQRKATLWFARRLRERFEGRIVVGGPDVSIFGEAYLGHSPWLDVAFLKEGEFSFVEYLQGRPLSEIPGVVHRETDGRLRTNPAAHEAARSVYRPDFDGFPLDRFLLPTLPISASRGCAYAKCSFCVHHQTYSGYYGRAAKDVADDIEYLATRHATRLFHFTDDMVSIDLGTEIADELARRGLDVSILAYARFEPGFTREILKRWHRGGFRVIEWGLESASPHLLKRMSKGISMHRVREILQHSAEAGILNKLMMFHNFPGETLEHLRASLTFVEEVVRSRLARPFFTVRNKLELRLNSELERTSRDSKSFPKRWQPTSCFQAKIEYADDESYWRKVIELDGFLRRMERLVGERNVFSTNDENLTLDLVFADLAKRGRETFFKSI